MGTFGGSTSCVGIELHEVKWVCAFCFRGWGLLMGTLFTCIVRVLISMWRPTRMPSCVCNVATAIKLPANSPELHL